MKQILTVNKLKNDNLNKDQIKKTIKKNKNKILTLEDYNLDILLSKQDEIINEKKKYLDELQNEYNVDYYKDYYKDMYIKKIKNKNINDQLILNSISDDNKLNNLLTKIVTKEFFGSENDSIDNYITIIKLYVSIYEYAIHKYINSRLAPENLNDKIKFVLKGDIAMLLVIKNINIHDETVKKNFNEKFIKNIFNKSYIDFEIIVNYNDIADDNKIIIFNHLYNLSFIVLILVRDYIVSTKYKFSKFDSNEKEQTKILEIIRTKIDTLITKKKSDEKYCKIGTNQIYEEAPCPNNVEYMYDHAYDELYFYDHRNNKITINTPNNIGNLKLTKQYQYILSSKIINEYNIKQEIINFGLSRMNIFFSLYKSTINIDKRKELEYLKCCNYIKGKSEFINVFINHPDSSQCKKIIFNNYTPTTINDLNCNIPNLDYFLSELIDILTYHNKYPWNLKEWENKLNRVFSFITGEILVKYTLLDSYAKHDTNTDRNIKYIIIILNNCIDYLSKHNDNSYNFLNLNIVRVNKPEIIDIQDKLIKIIESINNIDQLTYKSDSKNLNRFINISKSSITKMLSIIDKSYNLNRQQTGGFVMCANTLLSSYANHDSNTLSDNILKIIIDKLKPFDGNHLIIDKIDDTGSENIKTNELNELFYSCYEKLIETIKTKHILSQIFINKYNKEIYNSGNDADNIDDKGDIKKFDYNLNITSLMFLNFLLDYHCYLITYKGIEINTIERRNITIKNKFQHIEWTGKIHKCYDTYKSELLNKNPEQLLNLFCNDINIRFYRFIEILLFYLNNRFKKYINLDEIKKQMFEKDHKDVDINDKNTLYNYMYSSWKIRLAKFIVNKLDSINYKKGFLSKSITFFINNKQRNLGKTDKLYNSLNNNDKIKYFISEINKLISKSINYTSESNYVFSNDVYLSDSIGMFNNIFSKDTKYIYNNNKIYYSNCMASSLFEMYLLLRIYENGKYVGVKLQHNNNYSAYWKIAQKESESKLQHYAGMWNRLIYSYRLKVSDDDDDDDDDDDGGNGVDVDGNIYNHYFSNMPKYFRFIDNTFTESNSSMMYNIHTGNLNKIILQLFLYILIDYRISFIDFNIHDKTGQDKILILREIANKIKTLID